MAAAGKAGGLGKPSFVIVRTVGGKFEVHGLSDSSDPAFDFHALLKRNKREAAKRYGAAWLVLRGRVHKPLIFT